MSQRMYLISQEDKTTDGDLWKCYTVLGSTGNVYDVDVKKFPDCSCPDCGRGNLCKHILFVMMKVSSYMTTLHFHGNRLIDVLFALRRLGTSFEAEFSVDLSEGSAADRAGRYVRRSCPRPRGSSSRSKVCTKKGRIVLALTRTSKRNKVLKSNISY
jgi:hypothetical protein